MSLLISQGYHQPQRFTLGRLFNERIIVRERVNGQIATQAVLFFQALAAAENPKEMLKRFNKAIKELSDAD